MQREIQILANCGTNRCNSKRFDKLKDQKHISCEIQAKEMPIKDQTKQSKVDNNAESRFLQVSAPCGVDS